MVAEIRLFGVSNTESDGQCTLALKCHETDMASYWIVCYAEDGAVVVRPGFNAELNTKDIAVFPERVSGGFDGMRVAEFFAHFVSGPPPAKGSLEFSDAQNLASLALELAPDILTKFGFPSRTSPFSRHISGDTTMPSKADHPANHRTDEPAKVEELTVVETESPSIDLVSNQAKYLAVELLDLDAVSAEMGANKLTESLHRIDDDLTKHLNKLAEVLELDSSATSVDILKAAIERLRRSSTRVKARKALRMPNFRGA